MIASRASSAVGASGECISPSVGPSLAQHRPCTITVMPGDASRSSETVVTGPSVEPGARHQLGRILAGLLPGFGKVTLGDVRVR